MAVGGERYELVPATASFFRNHSWGNQAGRGGPAAGGCPGRRAGSRVSATGCCSSAVRHGGFYFSDPSRPRRFRPGRHPPARPLRPAVASRPRRRVLRGRAPGPAGDVHALRRRRERAALHVRRPRLGVLPGRRLLRRLRRRSRPGRLPRRLPRRRTRCGTSAIRRRSSTQDGKTFEFDHDWAENFVRLRAGDESGLAHFECVVIRDAGAVT